MTVVSVINTHAKDQNSAGSKDRVETDRRAEAMA